MALALFPDGAGGAAGGGGAAAGGSGAAGGTVDGVAVGGREPAMGAGTGGGSGGSNLGVLDALGFSGGAGGFGPTGSPAGLPFGEVPLQTSWEEVVTLSGRDAAPGVQFRGASVPELSAGRGSTPAASGAGGAEGAVGAVGDGARGVENVPADLRSAYSAPALGAPGAPGASALVDGMPGLAPYGVARAVGYGGHMPPGGLAGPFRQDALGQAYGPGALAGGYDATAGLGLGAAYYATGVGTVEAGNLAPLYGVGPAYGGNLAAPAGIPPAAAAAAAAGARARGRGGAGVRAAFGRGGRAGAPPASKGKPGAGKKGKGGRRGAPETAAPAGGKGFPGAMPVPKMGTFHSPYVPSLITAQTSMEDLTGAGAGYRHQIASAAPAAPGRPITDLEARQIGQCLQSLKNATSQLDSNTRDTVMHSLLRLSRSWVARNPGMEGNKNIPAATSPADLPSEATRNIDRCIAGLLYFSTNRATGPQEAS